MELIGQFITGASIDSSTVEGATSLIFTSMEDHAEIVKLLLENGANINYQDNYGMTALMIATIENSGTVV